jgi:hypothetical protein
MVVAYNLRAAGEHVTITIHQGISFVLGGVALTRHRSWSANAAVTSEALPWPYRGQAVERLGQHGLAGDALEPLSGYASRPSPRASSAVVFGDDVSPDVEQSIDSGSKFRRTEKLVVLSLKDVLSRAGARGT